MLIWTALRPPLAGSYATIFLLLLALPVLITLIFLSTRLLSNVRYRVALRRFTSASSEAVPPPLIPYTVPFMGHAHKWAWLNWSIGSFWKQLFGSFGHPRSSGACTLLLGGEQIHLLFSTPAIEAMFKIKKPNRLGFALQIVENVLGVDKEQFERHLGLNDKSDQTTSEVPCHERLEEIRHNYLLKRSGVDDLVAVYLKSLERELVVPAQTKNVGLIEWLQPVMLRALFNSVLGLKLLEVYPDFLVDFLDFDQSMQALFFGTPKFLNPKPHLIKERCLAGLEKWHQVLVDESDSNVPPADGELAWDPLFGSRYNRAMQQYHNNRDMTLRGKAGLDLGFCLATAGNALPATLWMLLHILNPQGDLTLPQRVIDEIKTAQTPDGSMNVSKLVTLPLLQSIYEEVLRLYHDALVTRNLQEDVVLPLDVKGERKVLLKKDSTVMAPSWLAHRDDEYWSNSGVPSGGEFFAERFLKSDPDTGKVIFSTVGAAGKLFPYGGGKTMCPGRIFAKQEMLITVALILTKFDFNFQGFVDANGKATAMFPKIRDAMIGSVVLSTDCDMKVDVSQRHA